MNNQNQDNQGFLLLSLIFLFLIIGHLLNVPAAILLTTFVVSLIVFFIVKRHWRKIVKVERIYFFGMAAFTFCIMILFTITTW